MLSLTSLIAWRRSQTNAASCERGPHRSVNYTQDEDLCLISSWLNVSKDPIVGTNQSLEAYWDHITKYYQEHKPSYSDRNKKSLQHRWDSINSAVSKFIGFKAQQDRLNESGKTGADRVCSGSAEPSDSKQPMGQDAAKKRKSGAPSDFESQCLEVLQQMATTGQENHKAMAAAREERSANQKAKLQILQQQADSQHQHVVAVVAKEKRKEFGHDQSIMDADLNAMFGARRDFYEAMQQRILTKYGINNNKGPSS
ncbi:hypothetical protein BS78_01G393200 [Paspalum vaginatum]|nr:hypothetical protein BS78_01G393200 [Paspalum vaginatum]